ncbi:hypothetical protein BLA27_26080 [Brucella cytisi]|uniref:Uncharacterized protein n=1 Tax=Brucella cytisi TaxID=407152 RepID=A0A1J6I6G8_9HYPH|nr:hypothetical protein BLA27_26080 [Brucella cytisi]
MNTISICRTSNIAGHGIRSAVTRDEPEQNFARSLSDLSTALPTPEEFTQKCASLRSVVTTSDTFAGLGITP